MRFKENKFLYIVFFMMFFTICVSYVRFLIIHDYIVAYEIECDPLEHTCFIGCENEECSEEYYYAKVQKIAKDIQKQCGKDISNCEYAKRCIRGIDTGCTITFCDPYVDDNNCTTSNTTP